MQYMKLDEEKRNMIIPPAEKHAENVFLDSWYVINRTAPTSGGNNQITFGQTQQQIQFIIPQGTVFNPSKVNLNCKFTAAAVAGSYAYIPAQYTSWINRMQVVTGDSVNVLMDVNNSDRYQKLALPLTKPFIHRSVNDGCVFPSQRGSLIGTHINDCDPYVTTTANGTSSQFIYPQSLVGLANYDLFNAQDGVVPTNVNFFRIYSINFGENWPDSFWAIDQDIYISSNLKITIYLSTLSNIGFSATTASVSGTLVPAPLASASISNVSLQYFAQQAEDSRKLAIEKSMQGFSLAIPFIYAFTIQSNGGVSTPSFNIEGPSRDPIQRLYKLYMAPFTPNQISYNSTIANSGLVQLNDCSNGIFTNGYTASRLWTYLTVTLNGRMQVILDPTNGEDYSFIKTQFSSPAITSEVDAKIYGGVPMIFSDMKDIKYSGEDYIGMKTMNGSVTCQPYFTIAPTFAVPGGNSNVQVEIFGVFLAPLHCKNGMLSWDRF